MKYALSAFAELDGWIARAQRILIAADFDGTLCPIADSPSQVRVAPAMLQVLRGITASDRLTLAVLSGRRLDDVRSRLPLDVTFAGNHGLEIEGAGVRFVHPEAVQLRPRLEMACTAVETAIRNWDGAWVEDKYLSATVHYRRVDPREHGALLFATRRTLSAFASHFALRAGKRALEIRPRIDWDKGSALNYVREHDGGFDACICLGDDQTDETMFRVNEGQVSIRVGPGGPTAANYYLSDPNEVAIFLSHLTDVCEYRRPFELEVATA